MGCRLRPVSDWWVRMPGIWVAAMFPWFYDHSLYKCGNGSVTIDTARVRGWRGGVWKMKGWFGLVFGEGIGRTLHEFHEFSQILISHDFLTGCLFIWVRTNVIEGRARERGRHRCDPLYLYMEARIENGTRFFSGIA